MECGLNLDFCSNTVQGIEVELGGNPTLDIKRYEVREVFNGSHEETHGADRKKEILD